MTNKKVSIVIPSWFEKNQNGRYGQDETFVIANECLKRLLEVTDRNLFELIIIDNGSRLSIIDEDSGEDKVSSYFSKADILIRNKENLGFGPACNQGIAVATGEYIVQMNNDIVVWSGWIESLLDVFNQPLTPPVGMVMPALEKSGIRFPEILDVKKEDVDMKTNAGKYGAHAQFGSLWCIKKSLLDELYKKDGFYFDPQFEMLFSEDRDLYQRVYALGYETYRQHSTRVHHIGNLTVSKVKDRKKYSADNREKLNKKWEGRKR